MAQYDLLLIENTAGSGVDYEEKIVNLTRGCLITANSSRVPAAITGTEGQYPAIDANGDLVFVSPGAGHTQNTDTGTTSSSFDIDSDTTGVKLKNNSGVLELRNLDDNAYVDLIVKDLTVQGTTTTINSTTITVDDKNIELGSVASPTDTTADGGGITLKGTTDKTIIWDNSNDNWTSNQNFNLASGCVYKINNVQLNQDNFADGTTNKAYTATEKTKLGLFQVSAPASTTATGTAGQTAYDSNYIYQCVASNTWRRATLAAWS